MVIDNFNIEGITAFESKTYSPLIVDADAPLALSVAFQRFQTIGRRRAQVINSVAASSCVSRIAARVRISDGIRRDLPVAKKRSVSEDENDRITRLIVNT